VIGVYPVSRGETIDERRGSWNEARPDDVDFTVLQVYPGSAIAEAAGTLTCRRMAHRGWYKGKPGEYKRPPQDEALSASDLRIARDYWKRGTSDAVTLYHGDCLNIMPTLTG